MQRVGILLDDNFEDVEVWYPLLRMREAGLQSFTVAAEAGKSYKGKYGNVCKADVCVDTVSADSLDCLIIPGGWCPDLLRRDARFVTLVAAVMAANKPLGSVCRGASLLCSANCVKARHLTCFSGVKDDVVNAGALYEDKPVVVDGHLVTSRLPTDLPQFCAALLGLLKVGGGLGGEGPSGGGKNVAIMVDFNFEDIELMYSLLRMREAGHQCNTVATLAGRSLTGKHGYPCTADVGIEQVDAETLDCLIIPGGWCPDYLRRDARFVTLVRDMMKAGKPVAAICHGAWMLCSAKCLQGRKLTCFVAIKDDVENAGGLYEDSSVVVDDNLISSRTPLDLPDFTRAILKALL